ncbi:hypothetical protein BDV93DRAFT_555200 [Ceratobasidium sp. AG-I]|nr:hypothetical protein BDV93DRAFT_555200 [Ceratobasidium sp. AG-I]
MVSTLPSYMHGCAGVSRLSVLDTNSSRRHRLYSTLPRTCGCAPIFISLGHFLFLLFRLPLLPFFSVARSSHLATPIYCGITTVLVRALAQLSAYWITLYHTGLLVLALDIYLHHAHGYDLWRARWHPYESGTGVGGQVGGPTGDKAEGAGAGPACSPDVKRRLQITMPGGKAACMVTARPYLSPPTASFSSFRFPRLPHFSAFFLFMPTVLVRVLVRLPAHRTALRHAGPLAPALDAYLCHARGSDPWRPNPRLAFDNTPPNLGSHDIGSDINNTSAHYYCLESPMTIPALSMHDLNYPPHRVLLLGGQCSGCLRVSVDRAVRVNWDTMGTWCSDAASAFAVHSVHLTLGTMRARRTNLSRCRVVPPRCRCIFPAAALASAIVAPPFSEPARRAPISAHHYSPISFPALLFPILDQLFILSLLLARLDTCYCASYTLFPRT